MSKALNGTVTWRWLGPVVFLIACALGAYIVKGVDRKVTDHELRIQNLALSAAVQQEILVRIESKIDSLLDKTEK